MKKKVVRSSSVYEIFFTRKKMFAKNSAARLSLCLLESWYRVINAWQLLVHVHKIKVSSPSPIFFFTSTFSYLMCKNLFRFFIYSFDKWRICFISKFQLWKTHRWELWVSIYFTTFVELVQNIWVKNWSMMAVRGWCWTDPNIFDRFWPFFPWCGISFRLSTWTGPTLLFSFPMR